MEMSMKEIKDSYCNAKNKKKQIEILADLNCCTKKEIERIIQKIGNDTTGSDIINNLYKEMERLDREIHEREIEYKKIVIALEVLSKTNNKKGAENPVW